MAKIEIKTESIWEIEKKVNKRAALPSLSRSGAVSTLRAETSSEYTACLVGICIWKRLQAGVRAAGTLRITRRQAGAFCAKRAERKWRKNQN